MVLRYLSTAPSSYILGGPWQRFYYRWKAIRFPWRKRYFVGMDLKGNTFWEYRLRIHAHRPRRIVDFRGGVHSFVNYGDFTVDPQWHQWLRVTRDDPPSIPELQEEVVRKERMAELARLADEKWAKKSSMLSKPGAEEVKRLEASAASTAAVSGQPSVPDALDEEEHLKKLKAFSEMLDEIDAEMTAKDEKEKKEKEEKEAKEKGKTTKKPADTTVENLQEKLKTEVNKRKVKGGGRPTAPSEGFQPVSWAPKPAPRGKAAKK